MTHNVFGGTLNSAQPNLCSLTTDSRAMLLAPSSGRGLLFKDDPLHVHTDSTKLFCVTITINDR